MSAVFTPHLTATARSLANLMRSKLASDSFWTLVASLSVFMRQGGFFVLLARLTSPTTIGHFALAIAWTTPIFTLTNLQLRQLLVVEVQNRFAVRDVYVLRTLMVMTSCLASLGIAEFFAWGPEIVRTFWGVSLLKAVDGLSEVSYADLQRRHEFRKAGLREVLRSVAGLGIGGIAMAASRDAGISALAGAIAIGLTMLAVDRRTFRSVDENSATMSVGTPWFQPGIQWLLIRQGLPMGAVSTFYALLTSIPRLSVERHLGAASLGYFTALGFITSAGMFAVTAACIPMLGRLAIHHAAGRLDQYYRCLGILIAVATSVGGTIILFGSLFGNTIVETVFGDGYGNHSDVLIWQLVSAGIGLVISGLATAVTAAQRFVPQAVVMTFATLLCLAASEILVPRFGLVGGAWASVLTSLAMLLGYVALLPRRQTPEIESEACR